MPSAREAPEAPPRCEPLFANHLAFLATHRGSVHWGPDWVRVDGSAPFLSSWTPLGAMTLSPDTSAVRLIPPAAAGWTTRLEQVGYERGERLSYMELTGPAGRAAPGDRTIRPVANDAEASAFAAVQAAGFLTADSPQRDWWLDRFQEAARQNYGRDDQDFLIAWADGTAAAVLLTVDTGEVAGIYAVATRPEHQRRGLSRALLLEARDRACARGAERLVLQAVIGSYAQGFYTRLGFAQLYVSEIWRLPER